MSDLREALAAAFIESWEKGKKVLHIANAVDAAMKVIEAEGIAVYHWDDEKINWDENYWHEIDNQPDNQAILLDIKPYEPPKPDCRHLLRLDWGEGSEALCVKVTEGVCPKCNQETKNS